MFNPKSYREICSELKAPEETLLEVLKMKDRTQLKVRKPARVLLVAAAMVAALAITVSAANPGAVQEIIFSIRSAVQVDDYKQKPTADDGTSIALVTVPEISLQERDGRNILAVDGEEVDITDTLAQDGAYQHVADGFTVDVTGTPGHWDYTVSTEIAGEGVSYSFNGSASLEG